MQDRGSITINDGTEDPRRRVAAVLAVKDLTDAKSRLAPVLSASTRRELVLAMMIDTVAAARAAGIDDVVVVTPDPTVAATVDEIGARPLDDGHAPGTSQPDGGPLNRALGLGIRSVLDRSPTSRVVVLQADLPTLQAPHLRDALTAATGHARAVVPDRSGSGTAMLILGPPDHNRPDRDTPDGDTPNGDTPAGDEPTDLAVTRFGIDSANAHRADGAVDLTTGDERWPDLRTDVDTVADLRVALALGVGPATMRVLERGALSSLGWTPTPHAS